MYVISVLPFASLALAGVGQWLFDRLATFRLRGLPLGKPAACVAAVVLLSVVGTQWVVKNSDALTDQSNDPYYTALQYVEQNLDPDVPILVDDSYRNPLADAGWNSDGSNSQDLWIGVSRGLLVTCLLILVV